MSRNIKIQVLFVVNNRDFTKSIKEHYTTVDNLMRGDDPFDYINGPEIIAKRQFTGATDCDGVDIYEGDIVSETRLLHNGKYTSFHEVKYKAPCFVVGDLDLKKYMGVCRKVVGNIHQHPELLA